MPNAREDNDQRARRGKRAISKDHAYFDFKNREAAARIVLADSTGKYACLVEWAKMVMEKSKCQ